MSEQKKAGAAAAVAEPQKVAEFTIAKVGDRWVRYQSLADVPDGTLVVTHETVVNLTKEDIGNIYSKVAGVAPKNFKDRRVAVESLAYQVAKMRPYDPSAPHVAMPSAKEKLAPGEKRPRAPRAPDTLEILQPANSATILQGMAPQARELVLIMADLAKEKGSVTFGSKELAEFLVRPEVAARLRTKQDPLRLLQYYRGSLITKGLVRVS